MRRFAALGIAISALLVLSVSAAVADYGAVGYQAAYHAGGVATASGALDVEAGKKVVVWTFTLPPGGSTGWHTHPDTLLIMTKGTLTNFTGCGQREVYEAGHTYLHRAGGADHHAQ